MAQSTSRETGSPASGTTARVLVVDDEENIAYLVWSALRLADLDVATATTGEEALAACTPAYPDLVVL
ncbi:MAG TPA: hypothetical protein VFI44_04570, partial [Ornithinibacter sp.]|nr:hypothetical protein [Ornithinibacter sp.]